MTRPDYAPVDLALVRALAREIEQPMRGILDGCADEIAELRKRVTASVELAPGRVITCVSGGQWWPPSGVGDPIQHLRTLQNRDPFRPTVFRMNTETMLVFLDHHWVQEFAAKMCGAAALERRSGEFTLPGLGDFMVDDAVPRGTALLCCKLTCAVLGKVVNVLAERGGP